MNFRIQLTKVFKSTFMLLFSVYSSNGQTMPVFSWLPPPSTYEVLTGGFIEKECHVTKVDSFLRATLISAHYDAPSYYSLRPSTSESSSGFIMITRPEQINEEYKPLNSKSRWKLEPEHGLLHIFPRSPGKYRIWVFVVSNTSFAPDSINPTNKIFVAKTEELTTELRLKEMQLINALAKINQSNDKNKQVEIDYINQIRNQIVLLTAESTRMRDSISSITSSNFPTLATACQWYRRGAIMLLDNSLDKKPIKYYCTALVYEFRDAENLQDTYYVSSDVIARDQLRLSNLIIESFLK